MIRNKEILYYCGFVLVILSTLFHVLGLSTPHWLESYEQVQATFDRLGLWTACFNSFAYDLDYMGKTYDGCHWIYSYEYKPIFTWLNPGWLVLVQVLMVMGLILQAALLFIMSIQTFFGHFVLKHRSASMLINSGIMFLAAICIGVSVSLFGLQARVSRQWLPRPDQNYLSWSFGLAVVGGFFAVFAAMCLFTDAQRLRFEQQDKRLKGKQDMELDSAMPLASEPVPRKLDLHMY